MEESKLLQHLPIGARFQAQVVSGSMRPLLKVNDSVEVKRLTINQIRIGDIVCLKLNEHQELIIHRVVGRESIKGKIKLYTQGDAVQDQDYWTVTQSLLIGLVIAKDKQNSNLLLSYPLFFICLQRLILRFRRLRTFCYQLFF